MDLRTFMNDYYRPIHGPLVLAVCAFGIGTQCLNIILLTRRQMRKIPSNILLAGLSLAQLVLLTNIIIGTSYHLLDDPCTRSTKTFPWLVYFLINTNMNIVFHTTALVHTTLLSVFRYAAVAFPIKCRTLISDRGAKRFVALAFTFVPMACSTFFANSKIVEKKVNSNSCLYSDTDDRPVYTLRYTVNKQLLDYNFIFFGAVFKILPCALMIILSSLLILELKRVHVKRQQLMQKTHQKKQSTLSAPNVDGPVEHNNRQQRQTTAMLVTVVLLLVVVEFPQGIMNLLAATLDSKEFKSRIYAPLGDFFEMLTVLYSSVNFIIYCAMSSQFRRMFKELFCFHLIQRPRSVDDSVTQTPASARRTQMEFCSLTDLSDHRHTLLTPRPKKDLIKTSSEANTSLLSELSANGTVAISIE